MHIGIRLNTCYSCYNHPQYIQQACNVQCDDISPLEAPPLLSVAPVWLTCHKKYFYSQYVCNIYHTAPPNAFFSDMGHVHAQYAMVLVHD